MSSNGNRYAIENLPISQKTIDGLSPANIDSLGVIGCMIKLQDEVYEKEFAKMADVQSQILETVHALRLQITELRKEVGVLRDTVGQLQLKMSEIITTVDCTQKDVEILKKDVIALKNHDRWTYHLTWVALGIIIGGAVLLLIHQLWFLKLHHIPMIGMF
jgi:hypothetical protein